LDLLHVKEEDINLAATRKPGIGFELSPSRKVAKGQERPLEQGRKVRI